MDRTEIPRASNGYAAVDDRIDLPPSSAAETAVDEHFWRNLELLFAWKRKHMPVLDMPQGAEVLIWLLKNATHVRPLKDLYRGSRFSEPTIRWVLKALVDDGFIVIDRNPDDLRVRTVGLTPKLVATVQEYFHLLRECVPVAGRARPPANDPCDLPCSPDRTLPSG